METFRDFYIFIFSFFLLDLPFLVHPSIKLWLILKIKINDFLDVSAASQIAEKELFFRALYLYSESGKVKQNKNNLHKICFCYSACSMNCPKRFLLYLKIMVF